MDEENEMIARNVQDANASPRKLFRDPAEPLPAGQGTVDLDSLLVRVILQQREDMRKYNVRLSHGDSGLLPRVQGDSSVLHQAFTIIIRNAIAAMPRGGLLAISATHLAQDGRPGRVEVRVENNGSGLPPEIRERVFLSDATTNPDGRRAGLAEAREAVVSSGGSMALATEPGTKSTVIVTLPAHRTEEGGDV